MVMLINILMEKYRLEKSRKESVLNYWWMDDELFITKKTDNEVNRGDPSQDNAKDCIECYLKQYYLNLFLKSPLQF